MPKSITYERTTPRVNNLHPNGLLPPSRYKVSKRIQKAREELQKVLDEAHIRTGYTLKELRKKIKMPSPGPRMHVETATGCQPEYPDDLYW